MKCELVIPDHVPSGPRSILSKILQLDPELRPSASELYCDAWVQGINQHQSVGSGGGSMDIKSGRSYSSNPPINQTQAMQIASPMAAYQI
jgi:serine/threonine protein kinase